MTTTIRGIPQTLAALARVRAEIAIASPPAVRAGGEILARVMAARAPRDTGRLASSIHVDVESAPNGATAHVGPTVPYSRFVEFGTVFMDPQPFAEDAAEESDSPIALAMASVYRAAIR